MNPSNGHPSIFPTEYQNITFWEVNIVTNDDGSSVPCYPLYHWWINPQSRSTTLHIDCVISISVESVLLATQPRDTWQRSVTAVVRVSRCLDTRDTWHCASHLASPCITSQHGAVQRCRLRRLEQLGGGRHQHQAAYLVTVCRADL